MIKQIKRLLGLESLSEKLDRLSTVSDELSQLNGKFDELTTEYTIANESRKELYKSVDSEEIYKSVESRFNLYQEDYLNQLREIRGKKDKLTKEYGNLIADPYIEKSFKELKEYSNIKQAYKENLIKPEALDMFLKAKQSVVKYADNLVFNQDGLMLILKRAMYDESQAQKWVIPGGHVDLGEDFEEAAIRELQEESGLLVDKVEKVGEYIKEGVIINYFRSEVNSNDNPVVLQASEACDFKWISPYSDLDDYEFPFNMKDNIKQVLGIEKDNKAVIIKALEEGKIDYDLLKSVHKYIRREGTKGNYKYIYEEPKENNNKEEISKEQREKNFKEWFGDSKVVDENGKPLVVYHGTYSKFNEFKLSSHTGTHNEEDQLEGIYFTDSKDGANYFALVEDDPRFLKSIYLSIKNPFTVKNIKELKEKLGVTENKGVKDKLISLGYDGLIMDKGFYANGEHKLFLAFYPNQIKSVTENEGTFDPNSNDITKSKDIIIKALELGQIDIQKYIEILKAKYQSDTNTPSNENNVENDDIQIEKSDDKAKQAKIKKVMEEFAAGTLKDSHGNKIVDQKQALTIAYSYFEKGEDEVDNNQDTIQKAIELGLIDEDKYIELLKAKPAQIGEIREWSGIKYQKTADSWVPVKKGSKGKQEDEPSKDKKGEVDLGEHAKNASQTQLESAIKQSPDPDIRQAAHQELERRQNEEHIKPEGEKRFGEDYEKEKKEGENKKGEQSTTKDSKIEESGINSKEFKENKIKLKDLQDKLDVAFENGDTYKVQDLSNDIVNLMNKQKQIVKNEKTENNEPKKSNPIRDKFIEKGLSEEEVDNLRSYTDELYKDLNQSLRSNELTDDQRKQVNSINSALDKLPSFEGKVYRGMGIPKGIEQNLTKWREGGLIQMKSFTSSSVNEEVARNFGDFQMIITSKSGKDVSELSHYGKFEKEVLFKTDTRFKIKKIVVEKEMSLVTEKEMITNIVLELEEI